MHSPRLHHVVARLTLALILLLGPLAPARAELTLGVAAGDTTQTSSVLWGKSNAAGTVSFQIASDAAFSNIVGSQSVVVSDAGQPAKWDATGLASGTQYYYRATDDFGVSYATGQFSTFAAPGVNAGLRFGVSGDWRGELGSYPAVKNVPARSVDFFVALGDTIYGDVASPASAGFTNPAQAQTLAEFRTKHVEVYGPGATGTSTLAALRSATSVFVTIDDHEVTNDFSGGALISSDPRFSGTPTDRINDSALFDAGLQAFVEYNPIRETTYGVVGGDGRMDNERKLYRAQQFGNDAAMFVLDARSFRDAEVAPGPGVFNPARTMLGSQQLADLKVDLLAAQSGGVLWKFVMVPEPIQQLGVNGAADRFEGYYAERNDLLSYIDQNDIQNVVFVAADIHGTLVNDLYYSSTGLPGGALIETGAFEVTTGSVAYDKPFTPTIIDLAQNLGLIDAVTAAFLRSLPPSVQDAQVSDLINSQIAADPLYGALNPLGLQGSTKIDFDVISGPANGMVGSVFGWTEFEIDGTSGALTVTTWGIDAYNATQLGANPAAIAALTPTVQSQFTVTPVPEPSSAALLLGAGVVMLAGRRRKAKV